ncbi:MAG: ABC transporter permease [Limisphaerales bacterium]
MMKSIFKCEIRNLMGDGTVWTLAIIFALVLGYAVYNGQRWTEFQQGAIAQAKEREEQNLVKVKKQAEAILSGEEAAPAYWKNPADIRGFSYRGLVTHAYKPPTELTTMSVGQSDIYPYIFKMNTGLKNSFISSYEIENPRRLLLGRFDPAFVVIYLFPLFILALGYNVISSEKEEGMLGLLLSQPVALSQLVLGKMLLRVIVVFGLSFGLLTAALLVLGFNFSAPNVLSRLGLWFLVAAAYGAFWFSLILLVNSRGWSSPVNATVLAGCWLILVVLLPGIINLAVKTVYPVPSRVEFITALRDATDDVTSQRAKVISKYLEDHPELAPQDIPAEQLGFFESRIITNEEIEQKLLPVQNRFETQVMRQQDFVRRLKYVSPALLAQDAFNNISGTGLERQRQFMDQVDQYHMELRGYFHPKVLRGELKFTGFDEYPRYQFTEEPDKALAERTAWTLFGLAGPTFLIGVIGVLAFRRYPLAY